MSERLETLNKARARMLEDRDAHAKVLAAPFDRDKAERARNKFIEIQVLIDALDRAIGGEGGVAPKGWPYALPPSFSSPANAASPCLGRAWPDGPDPALTGSR